MQVKKGDSGDSAFTEINVTPLVDVMLVLLVVFIITAPLIVPQNMQVNLPKTESTSLDSKIKDGQLVINQDGSLLFDEKPITEGDLSAALKSRSSNPEFQLQIFADKSVPYGRVAEMMGLSQAAGVVKLSFVTLPKK
ncbi:biopolymer transporter [Polynucleobacter sp. SHI8]|uniref:ExbD/TolR family protein n=1 Tax=unclassified Polynucleobacter TaxID=2640945 RepID=UPI0024928E1D|nr:MULTISPECIES: biopolymer transporter ExbD [unclassified Polynucleobacter]BDW10823.1 biopolymer transporter [Polynucleobacter sp. SHI2]BDW13269.1 biopolymer transporter [Polynucleobacter sp. SHI8]